MTWNHLLGGLWRALWTVIVRRQRPEASEVLPTKERLAAMLRVALAATSVFRTVGFWFGLLNGAVAALLALPGQRLIASAAFFLVSLLYGSALGRLGRTGWLAFPDSA